MLLEEIPGASERPGGCRIQVFETGDRDEVTIVVPPRPLPWILTAAVVLLALNLLVMLYTGIMLFFAHKSVLVMAQISPHDLPLTMHRWTGWLVLGWLALEGLGMLALATTVRPALTREIVRIGPDGVSRIHQIFGKRRGERIERENIRGFHLERDPQHLVSSTLSIQGRGAEIFIAENVSEADREWLHSVGNTLLRRL